MNKNKKEKYKSASRPHAEAEIRENYEQIWNISLNRSIQKKKTVCLKRVHGVIIFLYMYNIIYTVCVYIKYYLWW